MSKRYTPQQKQEAIGLRLNERLPAYVIADRIGVSRQICRKWLKSFPLTKEEGSSHPRPLRNNLVGNTYGRLRVIEAIHTVKSIKYRCICDCGKEAVCLYSNLYSGQTRSCGCYALEFKRRVVGRGKGRYRDKLPENELHLHEVVRYYKRNARNRGFKWGLAEEDVRTLTSLSCHYCGREGNRIGIDRVDNNVGYELNNVVPCCIQCNRAKRDRGVEEFKVWVEQVYRHLGVGTITGRRCNRR